MDRTLPAALDGDQQRNSDVVLADVVGARVAGHYNTVRSVLSELSKSSRISREQFRRLSTTMAAMHRMAVDCQMYARHAAQRVQQSPEQVEVSGVVSGVLDDLRLELTTRGVTVHVQLVTVHVIVDQSLLYTLVEVALRCMARYGNDLQVVLHVSNWPEHAILTLTARDQFRETAGPGENMSDDQLEGLVLYQLARTLGLEVRRERFGTETTVMLEFPRTVRHMEGLTALEIDGTDFGRLGKSRPLAGLRVLLVTDDNVVRDRVQLVCRDMGMVVDTCPSVRQAVRFCELQKPDGILIDELLRDKPFDELHADLLRYDVNFPFIEIAAAANVVAISWMADTMTRISRDALREQLASILVREMAKAL